MRQLQKRLQRDEYNAMIKEFQQSEEQERKNKKQVYRKVLKQKNKRIPGFVGERTALNILLNVFEVIFTLLSQYCKSHVLFET